MRRNPFGEGGTCPPAVFPARQIRKVDDTVSHLGDSADHFFSRSQVQLDRLARAAKDASDACISLQAGFVLSERAGADRGGNDHYNNK